ncbi:MAG TPA: SDR family oxidoreductase [Solirubrobacterales bacterium]|jgi:3-oxoacyl-[acyl-carrier protein] reductase|nr:SDR family oxidoreductase [Solirubrobacterales bacterium]
MDLGIDGRVALVMGASKGLGRGVAESLAREGARVAVASRSRERLDAVVEETDGAVSAFVADAGDLERLGELVKEVESDLGPIAILVANTGGPPKGLALDNSIAEWEDAYRSLVLGLRVLSEAVLPGMRERGWGRIVNIGSSSTIEPIPSLALSNANRLAAVGFLKTLSREVAGDGITVNTIATGKFATDRLAENEGSLEKAEGKARETVPAKRLGLPEEFGDLVAFLASDRAAYLTGTTIPLDGGLLRSV